MVWTILGVLAVPLLVLVNAMFVAAEFSLVSVRRTRVEEMVKARRAGAGREECDRPPGRRDRRHAVGHHAGQPGLGLDRRAVRGPAVQPLLDFCPAAGRSPPATAWPPPWPSC